MLEICKNLISKLNESNVRYVHFKSNEHLNESVEGETDFDILIDRTFTNEFERILLELDFKRFTSQKGNSYPGVDDWIGFDYDTGKLIHLHTHYQLVSGLSGFKHFVLPWSTHALDTCIIDAETNMKIVNPAFELVELYTRIVIKMSRGKRRRCFYRGYNLSNGILAEAEWLRKKTTISDVERFIIDCFGNNNGLNAKILFSNSIDGHEFMTFSNRILQLLDYHRRSCGSFLNFKSYFFKQKTRIIRKLKQYLFLSNVMQKKTSHTGGLMITFLGVDGSGKSTISAEITEWLSWKFEVSHMSLGFGRRKSTFWYKFKMHIKRLLKKNNTKNKVSAEKSIKSIDEPIKIDRKSKKMQKTWAKFAKTINRDIRRIYSYRLSGGIIVTDRYPQLQFDGIADGPKVNIAFKKLREKERNALSIVEEIQPDLVFKLFVPVEVSKARRPDDPIEVLEKKNMILKNVQYPKAKIVDVDATVDMQEELLFIKRQIWSMI